MAAFLNIAQANATTSLMDKPVPSDEETNLSPSPTPDLDPDAMADDASDAQAEQSNNSDQSNAAKQQDENISDSDPNVAAANSNTTFEDNPPQAAVGSARCMFNILDPVPGLCDSNIAGDDRHYISSFFGRNKACSTNIPDEYYLLLCRKCMQSMRYRVKNDRDMKEVTLQVKAIRHVVQNLERDGRWVTFEVQFTKAEADRRQDVAAYEEELEKHNEEVKTYRKQASTGTEKAKRRNLRTPLVPVPDWIADLCRRGEGEDFVAAHPERDPARLSFQDILDLLDRIEENCDVLPNIECLPVTQGELDQIQLNRARGCVAQAEHELEQCQQRLGPVNSKADKDPNNKKLTDEKTQVEGDIVEIKELIPEFEAEVTSALKQLAETEWQIPAKRAQAPRKTNGSKIANSEKKGKEKNNGKDKGKGKGFVDLEHATRSPRLESAVADMDISSSSTSTVPRPRNTFQAKGKSKQADLNEKDKGGKQLTQKTTAATTPSNAPVPIIAELTTPPNQAIPSSIPQTSGAAHLQTTSARTSLAPPPTSTTRSGARRLQREKEQKEREEKAKAEQEQKEADNQSNVNGENADANDDGNGGVGQGGNGKRKREVDEQQAGAGSGPVKKRKAA